MATVVEVMAKLSGNSSGMVKSFSEAKAAAQELGSGTESAASKAGSALGGFAAKGVAAIASVSAAWTGLQGAIESRASTGQLIAKLGISPAEAEKAAQSAGAVYADNWGQSLGDVTEATAIVSRALGGLGGGPQLEKMTKQALALADTFGLDVTQSMQTAKTMVNTGLAPSVESAYNLIAAGAQKGLNANDDLLETFNEYGTQFQKLGISGETAMGLLSQGMKAGARDTDYIADAIKEFSIRAVDGTELTAEGFQALGLDASKMSAQIAKGGPAAEKGLGTVLDKLRKIEDPAKRAQVATALFGTKAEDLGAALFALDPDSAAKGMGNLEGAMGKVIEGAEASVSPLEKLQRSFQIGLGKAAEFVLPAVDAIALLGPHIVTAGGMVSSVVNGTILPALQAFGGWFMENQGVIGTIATVIGVLLIPAFIRLAVNATISAAAQVAAWAASGAGAVKTAAIYLVQSYVMIAAWVRMGIAAVVSGAQTVAIWTLYKLEAIKGAAVYAAQSARVALAWVAMSTAAVLSGIKTAAVWTGTIIATAVTGAAAFVAQTARVVAGWAVMAAAGTINAVKMAASWVVGVLVPAVGAVIAHGIAAAGIVAGWVLMGIQSMIQAARMAAAWFIALGPVGWVIAIIIGLVALIIANWDTVVSWTTKAWTAVSTFIVDAWNNIVNWVKGAVSKVSNFISSAFNYYKTLTIMVWSAIFNKIRSVWQSIVSTVTNMVNRVKSFITSGFNRVKSTIVNIWNSIVSWVRGVPGKIMGAIAGLAQLAGRVRSFVQQAKTGAINKFNEIVNWVRGLPGRILSAIGNLGSLLLGAGGDVMRGLKNGITGAISGVVSAAKDAAGAVLGGIKNFFGIASPSKLMKKMGGFLMQGFGIGIDNEGNRAVGAMVKAAKGVKAAASFAVNAPRIAANAIRPGNITANAPVEYHGQRAAVNVTVNNYNPVAEPESKGIERAHDIFSITATGI